MTKRGLESALEGQIVDYLGCDRHDLAGCRRIVGRATPATVRGPKTVLTDVGAMTIDVPRDRDASSEPRIVAQR